MSGIRGVFAGRPFLHFRCCSFQSSTVKSSSLPPTSAAGNENVSYFCWKALSHKSCFFFVHCKTGEKFWGVQRTLCTDICAGNFNNGAVGVE